MKTLLRTLSLVWAIAVMAAPALAKEPATFEISIRNHQFEPAELRVPADTPLILKVHNLDPTVEEFESHALKVEKIIAGGADGTVRMRPLEPGRYDFIGEFHADSAHGILIAE